MNALHVSDVSFLHVQIRKCGDGDSNAFFLTSGQRTPIFEEAEFRRRCQDKDEIGRRRVHVHDGQMRDRDDATTAFYGKYILGK